MFGGLKKSQLLLAVVISLFFPVLTGYFFYCDLADDCLASAETNFENPDADDLFLTPEYQRQLQHLVSLGSNVLALTGFPEASIFEQPFLCTSRSFSSDKATLVLRC